MLFLQIYVNSLCDLSKIIILCLNLRPNEIVTICEYKSFTKDLKDFHFVKQIVKYQNLVHIILKIVAVLFKLYIIRTLGICEKS